MRAEKSTMCI
ncbi:unnamed protein product [Callosobruchus maculatus]|uniref:Uncharacterized protein n=1 Tax=Callosobruchus maculatus TaxID=64391 RepID=A0A653BZ05_CALMS|nr:unnamed protein product [Callosobruchus maculatus]